MKKTENAKPAMTIIEMEPETMMAASGISENGNSLNTSGKIEYDNAFDIAASKGPQSIWDFGEDE